MTTKKVEKEPLWCEDCGDDPEGRRFRCPRCNQLVCGWCWNHVHQLEMDKAKVVPSDSSKGAK